MAEVNDQTGNDKPTTQEMLGQQGATPPAKPPEAKKETKPKGNKKKKADPVDELPIGPQPNTGDPCPDEECQGKLRVVSSVRTADGKKRIQSLSCNRCNSHPENNKRVTRIA